jgi:hypothetical protein
LLNPYRRRDSDLRAQAAPSSGCDAKRPDSDDAASPLRHRDATPSGPIQTARLRRSVIGTRLQAARFRLRGFAAPSSGRNAPQKTFHFSRAVLAGPQQPKVNKSFLLLFFKKEALAYTDGHK